MKRFSICLYSLPILVTDKFNEKVRGSNILYLFTTYLKNHLDIYIWIWENVNSRRARKKLIYNIDPEITSCIQSWWTDVFSTPNFPSRNPILIKPHGKGFLTHNWESLPWFPLPRGHTSPGSVPLRARRRPQASSPSARAQAVCCPRSPPCSLWPREVTSDPRYSSYDKSPNFKFVNEIHVQNSA